MNSALSRLSDTKIEDDVLRTYLYKDVIKAVRSRSEILIKYEIRHDELYRPDLVAFRVYGSITVRWLVMLLCNIEDEAEKLPVGVVIEFPPLSYVRDRIRHYENGGGV